MNIKIDIELTPQELRQFIGLPDVAGLQDDMIHFVRDRVSKGIESVDVDALKEGIQSSRAWKRLMSVIGPVEPEITVTPRPTRKRRKRASKPRSSATRGTGGPGSASESRSHGDDNQAGSDEGSGTS